MSTLIVSTSYNDHAQRVEHFLRAANHEVIRLNLDLANLGSSPLVTTKFMKQSVASSLDRYSLNKVHGVFVHHPIIEITPEDGIDLLDRELCRASWVNALDWIEQAVDTVLWVNKPSMIPPASSSLRQLKIAEKCGLQIPATIFTNDLSEVVAVAKEHDKLVIKPGNLIGLRTKGQRMLARLVDVTAIDAQILERAPCLFQEYVEKAYEIRVHVIGHHVLACKIDSQCSAKTRVDWRNYDLRNTPHEALELDETLKDKCRNVVAMLGLQMGILDLICTPDNNIVFLECNAQGHWIWIEELTGLPITKILCELFLTAQ